MMNQKDFQKGHEIVEKILYETGNNCLYEVLINASADVSDDSKKAFYSHVNALFLHVLLNRLYEVGKDREQIVIDARRIIVKIIEELPAIKYKPQYVYIAIDDEDNEPILSAPSEEKLIDKLNVWCADCQLIENVKEIYDGEFQGNLIRTLKYLNGSEIIGTYKIWRNEIS